jgi:hypothetical protein
MHASDPTRGTSSRSSARCRLLPSYTPRMRRRCSLRFRKHSHLEGQHAFLSPSSYHWINYDEEKLEYRYKTLKAALEGVEQHRYAAICIEERIVQDDETTTVGLYINQCIQYKMAAEIVLFYSPNAFGTVDAIAYRHRRLRISDLKTGVTRTSEHQLEVYAALFCLEYEIDPHSLRGTVRPYEGDPYFIKGIMDKIVKFDKLINQLREEVSQ